MNDQLEANKRIVREWNDLAINQREPEEAVAKYLGPHYRQHNPGAADGPEPFIETVKRGLPESFHPRPTNSGGAYGVGGINVNAALSGVSSSR